MDQYDSDLNRLTRRAILATTEAAALAGQRVASLAAVQSDDIDDLQNAVAALTAIVATLSTMSALLVGGPF